MTDEKALKAAFIYFALFAVLITAIGVNDDLYNNATIELPFVLHCLFTLVAVTIVFGIAVGICFAITNGIFEATRSSEQLLKDKNSEITTKTIIGYHLLHQTFDFEGSVRRDIFWLAFLAQTLLYLALVLLDIYLLEYDYFDSDERILLISTSADILLFIPGLSIMIRRLHDTGRSGWWVLLIITIIGIVPLIVFLCEKTQNTMTRTVQGNNSVSDELQKLNQMYKDGVIDKAQFEKAKSKILD